MHPSVLETNRLFIFLTQEKSTAIVILSITHELLQPKWEICAKPGVSCPRFLLVNGDPIRQSVI